MDGLRSVFNERSQYLCQWCVSLLRFLQNDKLTRAEIVQNDHTVKIPFRKILESIDDVFLKLSQNEVVPSMGKKASSLFRGSGLSKLSVSIDARSTHVDRRVDECFHLAATICRDNIINTINLVYVNKDEVIWNTQSIAGSRLLQLLEKVLSNVSLAGFDADTLRTLIKILCLTMWVVNLSPPSVQSLPVSLLCIRVLRQLMRAGVR